MGNQGNEANLPPVSAMQDVIRIPADVLEELTPEQICLAPTIAFEQQIRKRAVMMNADKSPIQNNSPKDRVLCQYADS